MRKGTILIPEALEKLKSLLDRQYGDQELHDATFLITSTVLTADASLFDTFPDHKSIYMVSNILVPIWAEYINAGIIDPEKASEYLQSIDQTRLGEWAKSEVQS